MVSCARSEMIMPNGVGNLQKGERLVFLRLFSSAQPHNAFNRYANIDFIFAFVASTAYVLRIAISYDIACQWFINLFVRMREWPTELRLRPGLFLRPLIPKFHEPAHTDKDHEQYSFNLAEGVGLTDGKAPERIWAFHNALAHSTKSMGPGTMHDVYDDNFAYWNWMKYTGMGECLFRARRVLRLINCRHNPPSEVQGGRGGAKQASRSSSRVYPFPPRRPGRQVGSNVRCLGR